MLESTVPFKPLKPSANVFSDWKPFTKMLVLTHPHLTLPKLTPHGSVLIQIRLQLSSLQIHKNDAACVTYQAKISDPVDSPDIVVKFVLRYSKEVHKFLADHNHAPRLSYCGPLSDSSVVGDERPPQLLGLSLGPIQMIVMDYVSAPKGVPPPPDARHQLQEILKKLRSEGYVFGDLRKQNVLFDEENKAKLIDFDWAGRYDMNICDKDLPVDLQKMINENVKDIVNHYVCYPLNLNLSGDINWAEGVKNLKPIRPQHDWDMLDKLNL